MAPELFVWDVVTGIGQAEQTGPGGVTGSEQEAIACVGDAIKEIPPGLDAWGHVTRVRLELLTPTRGSNYQRLDRVAFVRRGREGGTSWSFGADRATAATAAMAATEPGEPRH